MDDAKALQEQARRERALLGSFCNDIESPLNVILNGVELLTELERREPGLYSPQQKQALQSIQDSAAVLGRMTENILDAYLCQSGYGTVHLQAMEAVSHFSQMAQLVRPCAARQQVELNFCCDAKALVILTDRVMADRVVLNLLSNAVYHGCARGHVWLELQPGEKLHWLRVRDDGPGLSEAMKTRLNSPGPPVPPASRGGGLGLYLCREFCRLLGWKMTIETGPQGTMVALGIPADLGRPEGGELRSSRADRMLEQDEMRRMVQREFAWLLRACGAFGSDAP